MVSDFAEKKETCFDLKKEFFKVQKILFSKGVSPCFGSKKCHFFLYLDLVKIRQEILLNYFEERKETFQTTKKNISSPKKSHYFQRG